MKLVDYKKIKKQLLRPRTLVFLTANTQVLLGLKKTGFGKGFLLGIGGKVENGETVEDGAKREVNEEVTVQLLELQKVATLNFYFPHVADESWNQQVHVSTATAWKGNPQESEEIKPQWFNKEDLPFDSMWDDAKYWLPQVLAGKKIEGEFLFNEQLKVADYTIKFLSYI